MNNKERVNLANSYIVGYAKDFITDEECNDMIDLVLNETSIVNDDVLRSPEPTDSQPTLRVSVSASLSPLSDLVADPLADRLLDDRSGCPMSSCQGSDRQASGCRPGRSRSGHRLRPLRPGTRRRR